MKDSILHPSISLVFLMLYFRLFLHLHFILERNLEKKILFWKKSTFFSCSLFYYLLID